MNLINIIKHIIYVFDITRYVCEQQTSVSSIRGRLSCSGGRRDLFKNWPLTRALEMGSWMTKPIITSRFSRKYPNKVKWASSVRKTDVAEGRIVATINAHESIPNSCKRKIYLLEYLILEIHYSSYFKIYRVFI